jgi:hypothetical protein
LLHSVFNPFILLNSPGHLMLISFINGLLPKP